ncbi:probable UDP-3-O-acylglucosamine N-acyltransferase 2, mitochondrial isoform X2 [Olea europaea var. sylvestris]|uniref:probable UDP-3-O-acylglucosamine N-acyltransferase 2, mitochondrial isoform X2 n=1 Tax=Olea europaea var. sylvestris TaxID=158386 RepID=UPI000C1CFB9D|nr:probable UDP-3-O-acylglucosamine N-acyltransferase 2, mitochondrial isoform X2 [Olea europaea var. sylvestris]
MAFRITKSSSLLSSAFIFTNHTIEHFHIMFTTGPMLRIRAQRHISTDQTSLIEWDDAKTDGQEFRKWYNGGGMFHKFSCIDPTAFIGTGALVHSKSVVAANAYIGSGSIVGPAVTVGQSTRLGYNVVLTNCTIGDFCIIHNGVCIGQDGFGFLVDEQGHMVKKPQNLEARIGNHVEIGANTCIDRGSWRDTIIGDHSKIDNLVQVGHNAVIGNNCIVCGQVGIAGSVTIGDYVTLGGRVAIRDHVCIASKVRLAANSCVTKNINESGDYGGFPAIPIREWRKQVATHRRTLKEFAGSKYF